MIRETTYERRLAAHVAAFHRIWEEAQIQGWVGVLPNCEVQLWRLEDNALRLLATSLCALGVPETWQGFEALVERQEEPDVVILRELVEGGLKYTILLEDTEPEVFEPGENFEIFEFLRGLVE